MSDRAYFLEGTQLAVETVSGTNVPANKQLQNTMIMPSVAMETQDFTPNGYKYKTVIVNGKEWTVATINGVGSYTDPIYLLSGLFGSAVITTPATGVLSRDWVWTPSTLGPDAAKTFSVEFGQSARAEKFAYGLITGLGMEFARNGVTVTGDMLGQLTTDGITLTASPTAIPSVPIVSDEIDIYYATTGAGLSSPTQMDRVFRANWKVSDKYGVLWPLKSANTSHGGHIEKQPTTELSLLTGADATNMALLTDLRNGATKFFRIKCTGSIIETTIPFLLQIDVAVKHKAPGSKTNTDGLTTIPWILEIVHDATWGKSMSIKMTNAQTAL